MERAMRTHNHYEEPTVELQALPGRTTYDQRKDTKIAVIINYYCF